MKTFGKRVISRKTAAQRERINVALAPFLRFCPHVMTLGIRPNIDDYNDEERLLLRRADRVFFPTCRYVDILEAAKKPTFPQPTTYRYHRSRLLQFLLLKYLRCPHPKTRIYFGTKQKENIPNRFDLPLLVMGPRQIPGTKYRVGSPEELACSLKKHHCIIVQECPKWYEKIRLVCVNFEILGALRVDRRRLANSFSEPVPLNVKYLNEPLEITRKMLHMARLDDVQIEWGRAANGWQVTDITRPPVRFDTPQGKIDRFQYIARLIETGTL